MPTLYSTERRSSTSNPAGEREKAYTIVGDDEFVEEFYLAEPEKGFRLFATNRLKRVHLQGSIGTPKTKRGRAVVA